MGLALRATHNLDDVLGKLDAWIGDVADVAAPRAVNKLADQAQVAGFRKVNELYRIGPRTMEKYASTKLASVRDLEATITVKGSGFPLYLFSPRQIRGTTKGKGSARATGGGVSIVLKGRRVLIPHAFIAKMKSGHVGVFARGAYGRKGKQDFTGETSGRFYFGRRRYSINELFTFSAPGAFSHPDVTDAMNDRVKAQFGIVMAQEIKFASR